MLLRAFGWRVAGPPPDVPKAVIIGGPHTSNWDGVFTLAAMVVLHLDARVMIKDSAFRGPLGWLLRWLGAMPIDRNSAKDVVQQTVDQFVGNDRMVIIVAPEGTRDGASQWKSGFWRIAKAASVPIIVATADYRKKEIAFPALVMPGDDMAADMATILESYRGVEPRHPARLSAPLAAMRREQEGRNV
jgi:1-acyl-sn-glycerol-3-phosphate acyltransferase